MRNFFKKKRMSCNVVIVGGKGVGKTALVNRFIHDSFSEVSTEYPTAHTITVPSYFRTTAVQK